jgi:RecB family exonuclease
VTRAKRLLTLTTVAQGRTQPSPFIEELLEPGAHRSAVEKLTPQAPPPAREDRRRLLDPRRARSRAYSQIGTWAESYRPPVPRPLPLSATAVESYEQCPQKYLFGSVWGMRGSPGAAAAFGQVMHSAVKHIVAALHKKQKLTAEDAETIFEREWSESVFRDEYQREEYRKAGREQIRAFFEAYAASPARVLEQEKVFELPAENDVVLHGRMDQINRLDGRKAEIVDYKTGRPREPKDAKKSLQLSIYAIAARDVLGLAPERLVFHNLTSGEAVAAGRDARSLEKAEQEIQSVAGNVRAGHFPAKPGFLCRWCDFAPVCPAMEKPLAAPEE